MRRLDLKRIRELVAQDYGAGVEEHYGEIGMQRLRQLTAALERIHEHLAYELLQDGLTVFATLEPDRRPLNSATVVPATISRLPLLVRGGATIQVLGEDELLVSLEPLDPLALAAEALVYRFDGGDHFVLGGKLQRVENLTPFPSLWGTPTFFELEDALAYYRDSVALVCDCELLAQRLWHDPQRRWILCHRPEDTLQRSLWRYLRQTMRGTDRIVEVDREVPVEGHSAPDIKVTWSQTTRIALIEVKWIGACVNAAGNRLSRFKPSERNANDGARQLVEYLEANFRRAGNHQTKGYLVVFDGRRRNLRFETEELSYEDATHFLMREIEWDPDYTARHDFATPLRCFMRPLRPAA
jgi:hypothetical protein